MARRRRRGRVSQGPARAVSRSRPGRRGRPNRGVVVAAMVVFLAVVGLAIASLSGQNEEAGPSTTTTSLPGHACVAAFPDPGRAPEAAAAKTKLEAAFADAGRTEGELLSTQLEDFSKGTT